MLKKIYTQPVTAVYTKLIDGDVGMIRLAGPNAYRFVQNLTGSTWAAGDYLSGATNDLTRGLAYQLGAAGTTLANTMGVALSAVPSLQYGWLQISGLVPVVNVEGTTDIAVGAPLIPSSGHNYGVTNGTVVPTGGYIIAQSAFTTDGTGAMTGIAKGFL